MKYFTLDEFAVSSSHPKLVEKPTGIIASNCKKLAECVLDKIREKLARPITITSGYRNDKLNAAVGGSSTSAHRYGLAADCICSGDMMDMVKIAVENGLVFDQIIIEYGKVVNGSICSPKWVHIGLSNTHNRMQILFYDGRSYRSVKIVKSTNYKFTV